MNVAKLNGWINDLMPKASMLAALDKVVKPKAIPRGDARTIEADPKNNRAPCAFEQVSEYETAKARPEDVSVANWNELIANTFHSADGLFHNLSAMWTIAGIFKEGPKIYCPTAEEFEGLARVEVGVPLSVYRQPFPVTILVVPEGVFPHSLSPNFGRPAFIAVRFFCGADDGGLGGLIDGLVVGDAPAKMGERRIELNFRIVWNDEGNDLIEARLKKIRQATFDFTGLGERCGKVAEAEADALEILKRVCLNACLLLSQQTPKLIGKANPAHAAKLAASRAKKLPKHVAAANERALHLMPTVYGFHQHIKVVERVKEENPVATDSCPPKKPHWRRGFWRNQTCGEGHRDRRLTFIPATLVNEHLLSGPLHNTHVTMTTR